LQPDLVLLGALASYLVYNLKSAFSPQQACSHSLGKFPHLQERDVLPPSYYVALVTGDLA